MKDCFFFYFTGEAYFIHGTRNGVDKKKDDVVRDTGNEIQKALVKRGLLLNENKLKERLARKEVEADIEELLDTVKSAKRFRLNKRYRLFCQIIRI